MPLTGLKTKLDRQIIRIPTNIFANSSLFCYTDRVRNSALKILEKIQVDLERFEELKWLINAPEIIADNRYWRKLVAEHASLAPLAEAASLLAEAVKNGNEDEITEFFTSLKKILAELQSGKDETAILEVTSSQKSNTDFASCLFSAYSTFAQKNNLNFSASEKKTDKIRFLAEISGKGAYSLLKDETGLHRAVFAHGRQADACVLVYGKMYPAAAIDESDIKIDLFHSGGAGGQNVNKVESAVRATHVPTGEIAVCQDERSQLKNKERAILALKKKVEQFYKRQTEKANSDSKATAQKTVSEGKTARNYDFRLGETKNSFAALTAVISKDGKITDLF